MWRAVALSVVMSGGVAHAVETIRIQVEDGAAQVALTGAALAFGSDGEDVRFSAAPGGRSAVRVVAGRLEIDGARWPEPAVRFRAGETSLDAGVPGATAIRANGFLMRGDVVVRVFRGRAQIINVLALEDYLLGVLGSEMPPSFPPEALKAQAVAARTYALQKKLDALDAPFHMGASVIHQVYGGLRQEDPRTRAAVEATRGEVLTWELQPIEAYFHASCGGRTETGLQALGRDLPYLQPVRCPCGALAASRWEAKVPLRELDVALGGRGRGRVSIEARTGTGRVLRLLGGGGRAVDGVSFRAKVGYTRIKSLSFDVEPVRHGDALHFRGRGYGHGAGMCQWGAQAMATDGAQYRGILAHYYPGTELQTLY